MFFQGQRFNKKELLFFCQHNRRIKKCELFQKLKIKLLRMNKTKLESLSEKFVFPLFSVHTTLMAKIQLRKKAVKCIKKAFDGNSVILTFFFSFFFLSHFLISLSLEHFHIYSLDPWILCIFFVPTFYFHGLA